jgi:putative ABC transport system permease protein
MKFQRLTWRELRRHPVRAVLTLLSVAIGVGAMMSVSTATNVTRRAYQQTYEAVTGRAALEVVAPEGGGFPQDLLTKIAKVPGVHDLLPSMRRGTILYLPGRRMRIYLRGVDLANPNSLADYELAAGRLCQRTDETLLDAAFAQSVNLKVDNAIKVLGRGGVRRFTVVGLLRPRGVAGMAPLEPIVMPLRSVQQLFSAQGYIDLAQLFLTDKADEKAVSFAIAKLLPPGVIVRRPLARTEIADETVKSAEQGMNFCAAFSLVAAVFIILNTFFMNVSERRRQLSILRAIGATRAQLVRLVLSEALLLGIVGSILGILGGWGGAVLLTRVMGQFFGAALPSVQVNATSILTAIGVGLGISLLAAYMPARWAGKISPLEGMMRGTRQEARGVSLWVPLTGAVVLVATELVIWATIQGWLPPAFGLPTGIVSLAACVLILPAIVKPLSQFVGRGLAWFLGAEGRLAERQVVRRQSRAAFTIGVLFVAVCSAIGMGNTIINNTQDVKLWLSKAYIGDFFIGQLRAALAGDTTARMPEEIGTEIAKMPGVENIDSMRIANVTAAGRPAIMIVKGFTARDYLPLDLTSEDANAVRQKLFDGEIVVGSVLAQRANLKPGDTISLATEDVTRQVRIAGLATEYLMGGLAVYMEQGAARRLFGINDVDVFLVKAQPNALASVEQRLRDFCKEKNLWFQSFADLSRRVDGIMAGVVGSLWVLLALAFVIAALGIANTLTMNVLEQTREIALLRVVAMTRQQVRRSIMTQAIILGVLGLGTGGVAGIVMSYVINLSLTPLLGHPMAFRFHPMLLIGCLAASLVTVLIAAWFPARRASQVVLTQALQYE